MEHFTVEISVSWQNSIDAIDKPVCIHCKRLPLYSYINIILPHSVIFFTLLFHFTNVNKIISSAKTTFCIYAKSQFSYKVQSQFLKRDNKNITQKTTDKFNRNGDICKESQHFPPCATLLELFESVSEYSSWFPHQKCSHQPFE